jgi:hypothetical protein
MLSSPPYRRFAVFPRRPSSDRVTDRPILSCGWVFFRVPSGSPCPPPRAPLLGFPPPSVRAFSARRAGAFAGRPRPARGVSPCVGCLPPSPPWGLAYRRRWALARHLSCACRPAAEVACAMRSRVCFAVGGRFLFRGRDPLSRFLARRRTARRSPHYAGAIAAASTSPVVHKRVLARLRRDPGGFARQQGPPRVFHTAIHRLWTRCARASTFAES